VEIRTSKCPKIKGKYAKNKTISTIFSLKILWQVQKDDDASYLFSKV